MNLSFNSPWSAVSLKARIIIGAAVAGLILLIALVVWLWLTASGAADRIKERDVRIDDLTIQVKAKDIVIQGLKAELKSLESLKPAQQQAVVAAANEVEQKAQELINEDERYKSELEAVSQPADLCERIRRICERAKQSGHYPADRPCDCQ